LRRFRATNFKTLAIFLKIRVPCSNLLYNLTMSKTANTPCCAFNGKTSPRSSVSPCFKEGVSIQNTKRTFFPLFDWSLLLLLFFVSFLLNQFNVPFDDCNDWEKRVIKPKAKPQHLPLSSFKILWRNVLLLRLVKQYFNAFLKCADKKIRAILHGYFNLFSF